MSICIFVGLQAVCTLTLPAHCRAQVQLLCKYNFVQTNDGAFSEGYCTYYNNIVVCILIDKCIMFLCRP